MTNKIKNCLIPGRNRHWQHGPLPPQRPLPVPPSSEYPHTAGYRPPYGNTIKALGGRLKVNKGKDNISRKKNSVVEKQYVIIVVISNA